MNVIKNESDVSLGTDGNLSTPLSFELCRSLATWLPGRSTAN